MDTATQDTVDSLQATIEPLESLHGEHSQLEMWVHDSFAALEKLHSELTEWQSELARKQTELDLREDDVRRQEERVVDGDAAEQLEHWRHECEETRQETQVLEEENAEQLQELDNLELMVVQLEKRLHSSEKRNADLTQLLEMERTRADQEQHQWQGEFKDMRRLLEKQCSLLEDRIRNSREAAEGSENDPNSEEPGSEAAEAMSRTAELRRRAKARRSARLKKGDATEESSD